MTVNIKKKNPHKMRLNGKLGREIYSKRIEMMADIYPDIKPDEQPAVLGIAHFMNQMKEDATITHPVYDISCVMNSVVGPSAAYLISCGRFSEDFLRAVVQYIKPHDKVLCVGAGFGLSSVLAAKISREVVVAVEPSVNLHHVIVRNAKINNVNVVPLAGCIVPGEKGGKCSFYLDEDIWSSSIYSSFVNSDVVEVEIVTLENLIENHNPNTLLMDIQGAEISLLTEIDTLNKLEKIIVKIHDKFWEGEGFAKLVNALNKIGFELKGLPHKTCVFMK